MRLPISLTILCVGLLLVSSFVPGCAGMNLRSVREDRLLHTDAPTTGGLVVRTSNGSVSIERDPARADVEIAATVTASAPTEVEAQARLKQIQVVVAKTTAQGLEISVQFPDERRSNEGCSFVIKVPSANGVNVDTGNGSVVLKSLDGNAIVRTSNGGVSVSDQGGTVDIDTSNGEIKVEGAGAAIHAVTSNGGITIVDSMARVEADTSNGEVSLRVKDATAGFTISTSNGGVTLSLPRLMNGTVRGTTSNGRLLTQALVSTNPIRLTDNTRDGGRFELVIGAGGSESTLDTSNGNITLDLHD